MLKFFALKKLDFNISGNYSSGFFNTNSNYSGATDKTKTEKNPLHLMQNVSDETLMLWLAENPASKLGNFQPATASPYRVLHQVQGDKQEINLSYCNPNGAQNAVHI